MSLADDARAILSAARSRLALEGLHIVLPIGRREFDDAVAGLPVAHLDDLLVGAGGALLVGDGGPDFFARFFETGRPIRAQEAAWPSNPLDGYTYDVLTAAVADVLVPWAPAVSFRLIYPFVDARPALPFQRLGQAAGLPAPGPLGIQIHPIYGPWWAYRAIVVMSAELATEPVLGASCLGCARPCADACPGGAVTATGFSYERCGGHRMVAPACRDSCAARIACPVGFTHRYPAHQLAFHMKPSLRLRSDRS